MLPPELEHDESALAESRTTPKKPPLFKVLLHNDDFTTMEFVVQVLETIFGQPHPKAVQIMLHVHTRGAGVAGIYTHEIAEMKVGEATALARAHEFPLLCTMEEA
ncbi:MAG TPA: ATP-dependent Clp protease adaptor ClpS [Thermoanaerobaculia bacterium]|nr:ATP-dependent Clp protease adaptor ClpS [Thermoanaerobaculia bacterium]